MDTIDQSPKSVVRELVPFLAIALLASIFTPSFMKLVLSAGHQIAQPEMASDYLVGVVWAFILAAVVVCLPLPSRDRLALLGLWAAKALVALSFMLIYENHYGLDAFGYFKLAHTPFEWSGLTPGHGTEAMTDIARLHYQLGLNSYHAMKLDLAMVGLAGVWIFYRAAVLFLGREDLRILLVLGLTPSILFWSSILGKDPLVMLGVAIYSYGAVALSKRRQVRYLLLVALGIVIASLIRVWLAPIMALPLAVLLLFRYGSFTARILWATAGATLTLMLLQPLMDSFKTATAKELIEAVAHRGSGFEGGGSAQGIKVVIGGWGDLVRFAPWGSFSALFRPLPGEVMNAFGLMSGLEDLVLLFLLARALGRTRWRDLSEPVILGAVTLLAVWSVVYGLISSHNMGSAVRYRLQVLPVLILIMLYLGRPRVALSRIDKAGFRSDHAGLPG